MRISTRITAICVLGIAWYLVATTSAQTGYCTPVFHPNPSYSSLLPTQSVEIPTKVTLDCSRSCTVPGYYEIDAGDTQFGFYHAFMPPGAYFSLDCGETITIGMGIVPLSAIGMGNVPYNPDETHESLFYNVLANGEYPEGWVSGLTAEVDIVDPRSIPEFPFTAVPVVILVSFASAAFFIRRGGFR